MTINQTVTVAGVSFDFSGCYTNYEPAKLTGHPDTWHPAYGGELDTFEIHHAGDDITELLSEVTVEMITDAVRAVRGLK